VKKEELKSSGRMVVLFLLLVVASAAFWAFDGNNLTNTGVEKKRAL
jgi:hypothetical protein